MPPLTASMASLTSANAAIMSASGRSNIFLSFCLVLLVSLLELDKVALVFSEVVQGLDMNCL